MSIVTLHVNMAALTVEDRLLIKTERAGLSKKTIVEFLTRQ